MTQNKIFSFWSSLLSHGCDAVKNAITSYRGKVFAVLAFSGITLLAIRWFFSSSTASTRKSFDYKHIEGGKTIAEKLFNKIVNPKANNGWDWIYTSQKDDIFRDAIKGIDGIQFGRCCALGKEIIRSGKILSVDELQKIEQTDKFPKRALGFKLFQIASHEIYQRFSKDQNTPAFERPSQFTPDELEPLGQRAKYFCYQRHVECLQTYGLSFQDVSNLAENEFAVLQFLIRVDVPFNWARDEVYKNVDLKTGKELLEWAVSQNFPSICESTEEDLHPPLEENEMGQKLPKLHFYAKKTSRNQEPDKKSIERSSFQHFPSILQLPTKMVTSLPTSMPLHSRPCIIYPKNPAIENKDAYFWGGYNEFKKSTIRADIENPNFSGFFIVSNFQLDPAADQAFLLEIDNQTQTYVLYDSDFGFYSGKTLNDCINKLNKQGRQYGLWVFNPYIFKA